MLRSNRSADINDVILNDAKDPPAFRSGSTRKASRSFNAFRMTTWRVP